MNKTKSAQSKNIITIIIPSEGIKHNVNRHLIQALICNIYIFVVASETYMEINKDLSISNSDIIKGILH